VIDDHVEVAGHRAMVLGAIRNWADRGWLRRLDAALASFIAELSPEADGTVLLAIALTAHLEGRGHTCLVLDELLREPDALLQWSADAFDALRYVIGRLPADERGWIDALSVCEAVHVDDGADAGAADEGGEPLVLRQGRLYLRRYWRHERQVAASVASRSAMHVEVDEAVTRACLDRLFPERVTTDGVATTDWQKAACAVALQGRFTIITGGPGTGKTYTAARLLAALFATTSESMSLRIALAAPTGKAAARLKQSVDTALASLHERFGDALPLRDLATRIGPAKTLHALLGTQPGTRRFRHDASRPLDLDVLIVDEASMVHIEMMDALLAALPATTRVILLGDKDQLASVEAGAVLGELCRDADTAHYTYETVERVATLTGQRIDDAYVDTQGSSLAQQTVMLRRSERFGGAIDRLAQAVNAGRADEAAALFRAQAKGAIAWTLTPSPLPAIELATKGRTGAPGGYGTFLALVARPPDSLFVEEHEAWVRDVLAAFDRFRVLCAIREGEWGVAGLNRAIEQRLADDGRISLRHNWYEGRPVIVTRNHHDLGVFNGDVGIALRASANDARLRVHFAVGPALRSVSVSRLSDVETAFAMTVHKSQGSEFDHTVLILPPDANRVATRELLYTGITRARSALTLVSTRREALVEAIAQTTRRSSGLRAMMAES
jgi:exodeoxyribonuclease V alpha subunit